MTDCNCDNYMWDENCVQIILFYGSRGRLVQKMAETCGCEETKASEFIHQYFTFLTKKKKPEEA